MATVLAKVQKELGPSANITSAQKVRSGGVLGFFAREKYEVVVDVDTTKPAVAKPAPAKAPTSLADLVEAANAGDVSEIHLDAPPAPQLPVSGSSNQSLNQPEPVKHESFADVLSQLTAHLPPSPPSVTSKAPEPADHPVVEAHAEDVVIDVPDEPVLNNAPAGAPRPDVIDTQLSPSAPTPEAIPDAPVGLPDVRVDPAAPEPLSHADDAPASAPLMEDAPAGAQLEGDAPAGAPLVEDAPASAPLVEDAPAGAQLVEDDAPASAQESTTSVELATSEELPVAAPRTRITDHPLARLGLPVQYIPRDADMSELRVALEKELEAGLPMVPNIKPSRGSVIAVVGERYDAMDIAEELAQRWKRPTEEIVLASQSFRGKGAANVVRTVRNAEDAHRSWSRRNRPTIVAVEAEPGRTESDWAGHILAALEPIATYGVTDATRKAADVKAWAEALGGLDILAINHIDETVTPADILATGIPVETIDGTKADASYWALMLTQRLAST